MKPHWRVTVLSLVVFVIAACSSGPVKRVSQPAASIQQLTVRADGSWLVELRLQNYSSMPMSFDTIALDIGVGGQAAGNLQASPGISIGPASGDVVAIPFRPTSDARIVVADALASHRSLDYRLHGTVAVTPDQTKQRSFDINASNRLTPAPGLEGVLR